MKKNDLVKVFQNPKNDSSPLVGTARLLAFDNNQVYLDGYEGFENWRVEINGMERNCIVHSRHLVKE